MATLVRVESNLQWQVLQGQGGNWVAFCEPMQLTVQAETWADLMEDIGHTLNAVMLDLYSSNELPQFLHDRGWKLMGTIPNRQEDVRFDVPFFAMLNGSPRDLHQ